MKRNHKATLSLLAAAMIILALLAPACSAVSGSNTGNKAAGSSAPATGPSAAAATTAAASAGPAGTASTVAVFAAAFKTVDKNPLNEAIQYALWLAANAPEAANTAAPGGTKASEFGKLLDKYAAIVAGAGVHYTEVQTLMGMDISTEVWLKAGKFRTVSDNDMVVFDGSTYVKIDLEAKKGIRYTKDQMLGDINSILNGRVPAAAASAYQQKKDQKVGKYNCSVFYMDFEMMGMKGNTLYVDKDTGMLVKYVVGDEKDKKKNNMIISVTKFAKGGFGDDMFAVPAGITVEDYK